MKQIFSAAILFTAVFSASLLGSSCSDSSTETGITVSGTGVTNQTWGEEEETGPTAVQLDYNFTAADAWNAISSQPSWCTVLTPRGRNGNSILSLQIAENTTSSPRTAIVTVNVAGCSKVASFKIIQSAKNQSQSGTYADVDKWMLDYMKENYLWNEPLTKFTPDYSLDYEDFLISMLEYVDKDNHRNRDDGHWVNGQREYYYSFIEPQTSGRAMASRLSSNEETGSGITYIGAAYITTKDDVALIPLIVAPGTSAASIGIKRGDLITKVGGTKVNETNYLTLVERLVNGNTSIAVATVSSDQSSIKSEKTYQLGSTTFTDPSIYTSKVMTVASGKKVAYLCYMTFEKDYDSELLDVFRQFKSEGATELVLDLRYNGGGHVLSSAVLGTLVAGNAHKNKVYNHTTYNASRTKAGEDGKYHIGSSNTPEGTYSKISTALTHSLNLSTIYVLTTENTASASELVINGLRGLDITVNIIGTTTNGKNVGMETISEIFSGTEYLFAPITFYSQNAKNFRDYSDGFTPDLNIDESEYVYEDFGTETETLLYCALQWIDKGRKPSINAMSRTGNGVRRGQTTLPLDKAAPSFNRGAIAMPGFIEN